MKGYIIPIIKIKMVTILPWNNNLGVSIVLSNLNGSSKILNDNNEMKIKIIFFTLHVKYNYLCTPKPHTLADIWIRKKVEL